jgi:hypothetical protein
MPGGEIVQPFENERMNESTMNPSSADEDDHARRLREILSLSLTRLAQMKTTTPVVD